MVLLTIYLVLTIHTRSVELQKGKGEQCKRHETYSPYREYYCVCVAAERHI